MLWRSCFCLNQPQILYRIGFKENFKLERYISQEPRSSSERTLSQNQVFGDLGDPNKETDTKNVC